MSHAPQTKLAPRLVLLATAQLSLLLALWSGLLRLPIALPTPFGAATLALAHGPLMVCGFIGTLVGLERAVALSRAWAYVGPLASAAGAALTLAGMPHIGVPCVLLAALLLVVVQLVLLSRQPSLPMALLALGAASWLAGNALWLAGLPLSRVVAPWSAFLVLTIVAERRQLSQLRAPPVGAAQLFIALVVVLAAATASSAFAPAIGARLAGVAELGLALWLWRYDIAALNARRSGLSRYSAIALLGGFLWLAVAGVLALIHGAVAAGPAYDAIVHARFVGFVMAMIFAHAPIIFPAVLGRPIPYTPLFYGPLALLWLSLAARLAGDLAGWPMLRRGGGLLGAVAIVGFFALVVSRVIVGRRRATDSASC